MTTALQIRRGIKAALPLKAALGEPLIAVDTREIFIGRGTAGTDGPVYKLGDVVFASVAPSVEKEKIWIDTTNNSLFRASDDGLSWVPLTTTGSGGSVSTDFQVYGVTQGSYSDGAIISAGTSLEDVVKNMLQTIIPPTYTAPSLTLAGSGTLNIEAGTSINPLLTQTFTQRDGGTGITFTLKKDGVELLTNPDGPYIIGDEAIAYQATQTYNQGPIKNDNQGNAYPTGQIQAGTATSNTVTYTGKRRMFYGFDSSDVRTLPSILGPANGQAFTLNIPAGTTKVVFAYPATLRDVTSVKYVELGNGEVKDTFTLTTESVAGFNLFTPINYKVYTYTPAVPFSSAVTYSGVI